MSDPQKPEDNPYLAAQVADVPLSAGKKTPGPLAIIGAILVGGITAVVTFCLTFFFTCLGFTGPGRTTSSSGTTFSLIITIAVVTAIAATGFVVWGFLKIASLIGSNTNQGNKP